VERAAILAAQHPAAPSRTHPGGRLAETLEPACGLSVQTWTWRKATPQTAWLLAQVPFFRLGVERAATLCAQHPTAPSCTHPGCRPAEPLEPARVLNDKAWSRRRRGRRGTLPRCRFPAGLGRGARRYAGRGTSRGAVQHTPRVPPGDTREPAHGLIVKTRSWHRFDAADSVVCCHDDLC
jgi:hypothetical protein